MYKRIFIFGCSYSAYAWPTWADITVDNTDIEAYNYGVSGIGNVGIYNRLIASDIKHKFTDEDTIIVQWTSFDREAKLRTDGWEIAQGSVGRSQYFDEYYLRKYWNETDSIVKNFIAITSANKIFPNLINLRAKITFENSESLKPSVRNKNWALNIESKISKNLANFFLEDLPETTVFKNYTNYIFKDVDDGHPDVLSHLRFAETVSSLTNIPITEETKQKCRVVNNYILNKGRFDLLNHDDIIKYYPMQRFNENFWREL